MLIKLTAKIKPPRRPGLWAAALGALLIIGLGFSSPAALADAEIEVTGNKRTKAAFIAKLARICLYNFTESQRGRRALQQLGNNRELALQTQSLYLKQCLTNSGLFVRVNIPRFDDDKIEINVQDRWSFLALPSYSTGPDPISTQWGLLVFDFNTGGRGQLVGFIFNRQDSTGINSYSLLYEIPYVDQRGKYGFSLAGLNRVEVYYAYEKDDWNYRVTEQFNFLWLRLKQRLTPELSLTYGVAPSFLGFSDEVYRYEPTEGLPADIENPAQEIQSATLNFEWSNLQRRYYYERGFRISNTLFHQLSNSQKEIDTASLMNIYVGVPSVRQQVFQLHFEAGSRNNVERYNSWRLGGELGARAIPIDGAWSQHFAFVGLDYQTPITQGQYGYWNFGPFLDFGYQWNLLHRPEEELGYYGYGISSFVHLRRVNVPAFGLNLGSNSEYAQGYASFFAGFRF